MKKALSIVNSIIALFFILWALPSCGSKEAPPPATMAHVMVNNRIYWASSYPNNTDYLKHNLVYIGSVEKNLNVTPTDNFQAYDIPVGTEIYYDSASPQIIYLCASTSKSMQRFATWEACMDYVFHNEKVYVSLASLCSWDYERYTEDFLPVYGENVQTNYLPKNALFLGNTVFVGYNEFVTHELDINSLPHSESVYQDFDNPCVLYVGEKNMIYVPYDN